MAPDRSAAGVRAFHAAKVLTVFRSRLNPYAQDEYAGWAARMSALAQTMPGYVSHKGFVAADGERVMIVGFESAEAQRAWRAHPEHQEAQKKGRAADGRWSCARYFGW